MQIKATGSINVWHLVASVVVVATTLLGVRFEMASQLAIMKNSQEANTKALERHEAMLEKLMNESHVWQFQMNEKLGEIRILIENKQDR